MITLTNGVQIPENAVQLQTTAAIDGLYVTQPFRLVQYDETLPVAAVQLTYQNQPYTPPTGAELNVRMGKPDGKGVYNPCLGVDSNGVVYFVFTQQMTVVAGYGTLTVEVTDNGVKNSAPIIVDIRRNPVPEGAIASTDEFLTLQEILAEAEKWGQIVQANASNIQQVVDNLTDIRNAAENAQAAAASAAAAQQAAQEALGFRTFFSAVRPDSNGNLDPSRPMTVGPAASVEIESAGDRIQSVTALGFTTQAGTGDPSPTNVRALTNGGLKLVKLVLNDTSGVRFQQTTAGGNIFRLSISTPAKANAESEILLYTNQLFVPVSSDNRVSNPNQIRAYVEGAGATIVFRASQESNWGLSPFTTVVQNMAASGNPLTVWYVPADESQATGLYAPIILSSGEYRANCLELTAPLCEGDSVVSYIKSGCDKVVVLDGTQNIADANNVTGWFQVKVTGLDVAPVSSNDAVVPILSDYLTPKSANDVYTNHTSGISVTTTGEIRLSFVLADFPECNSVDRVKTYLAAHPLNVWYRSTNYTPAADIPVSLETHQQAVLVLDGTESVVLYWNGRRDQQLAKGRLTFSVLGSAFQNGNAAKCSHFAYYNSVTGGSGNQVGFQPEATNRFYFCMDLSTIGASASDIDGTLLSKVSAYLAAQYAAGTPVTIVYELATPITYAHPAVILEAATGDQLTYTVTGQSGGTVSVSLKPFQDGGNAKTADNAQQLDGLTLLAIKESMTPVGYIFSWAPTSGGPDLSTASKVAAYFGFGTWQAYGTGRVLVGVDSGQTEFATVGQTGGEKTHTLTTAELAKHSHKMYWSNEGGTGSGYGALIRDALSGGPWPYSYFTETDGGGQPHNNLQPYITVYRWQRIA